MDDIFTTHSLGTTQKTGSICFPEEMPPELRILLIEVRAIKAFTQQMSPEVEQAVDVVVERIKAMVGEKVVMS